VVVVKPFDINGFQGNMEFLRGFDFEPNIVNLVEFLKDSNIWLI
ncbi:hypothetical protein A2U01_0028690, partial [Trifolium medium]|nr:hypothetical protein [Trifolium medium]